MKIVNDRVEFEVDVKGESGKIYKGMFVMKLFLTLAERRQVAVEFSRRDAGNDKDPYMSIISKSICELQAHVVDCPDWFSKEKVWEIYDTEPVMRIRENLDAALEEYIETNK